MREFTLLYEELMGKIDGMSRAYYDPENFSWWAKNLRRVIVVKQKAKSKDHKLHEQSHGGCNCSSIAVKVSKVTEGVSVCVCVCVCVQLMR